MLKQHIPTFWRCGAWLRAMHTYVSLHPPAFPGVSWPADQDEPSSRHLVSEPDPPLTAKGLVPRLVDIKVASRTSSRHDPQWRPWGSFGEFSPCIERFLALVG